MLIPLVVFLSGASIMIVEVVGSRVIAPYVGSSIHAWTALISVILGSLSVGYALGGKFADKYPSYKNLSIIFFLAAGSVALIKIVEGMILPLISVISDIRLLSIILSICLFTVPSIFLGMISPYTIRLSLHSLSGTGRTAGNLNALSTIGSIVGTILTGFYLLGTFGHSTVLLLVSGILIACGLSLWLIEKRSSPLIFLMGIMPLLLGISFRNAVHPLGIERETNYQRIFAKDNKEGTARPIRTLMIDLYGIQSAMYLDKDDDLVAEYTKVMRVADAFVPRPATSLLIGGAGYSIPKDFLRRHQNGTIDVVEIDPGMTEIAKEFFQLPESERLTSFHADGRVFLTRNTNTYDVIYMDAFGELITPPFHLLTREMFETVKQRLSPQGVLVMNAIGTLEGKGSVLFSAVYTTLKTTFSSVYVYPVYPTMGKDISQNIILVAVPSDMVKPTSQTPLITALLDTGITFIPNPEIAALTDEFAPVEQYAADMTTR